MTTVVADAKRDLALKHFRVNQVYEFLAVAEACLSAEPQDHELRLMSVQAYLELGLILPAQELIAAGPWPSELEVSLRQIRTSLEQASSGVVPWSRHAGCYEDNLAALGDRGVDVTAVWGAWSTGHRQFQLLQDKHGVCHIRRRASDGVYRWLPPFGDHRAREASHPLPADVKVNMPGPYLFDGVGMGWYFERVYQATLNTFLGYSCALYVVEASPEELAAVLHLHDWSRLLADARVHFFLGEDWVEQLQRRFEDEPDLPPPRQVLALRPERPAAGAAEAVRKVVQERDVTVRQSLADLESRYAERDGRYWAQRFSDALAGRGEPLRILGSVSTHTTFLQYSMRDAQRAFEQLGHRFHLLSERAAYHLVGPLTYHNVIREYEPDLFFCMDHLRPEFGPLIPSNLPVFTWDQDQLPHVFTKENIQRVGPLDFVAGWSKARCVAAGCNPAQLLYARVPTSPDQFGGRPLTDAERRKYGCDVSYVSHASQTPERFHEQERARLGHDALRKLLDEMYRLAIDVLHEHVVMSGALAVRVVNTACRGCGIEIRNEELRTWLTGWYLWRLGDRVFRHEALGWVAQWAQRTGRRFRLYGNGWEGHPTLSAFAAGPAQNGRELTCIYRASTVNLQLMPAGFLHQRALDGLAAGGFFLSRATPVDLRGHTLRNLERRIRQLGITTNEALLSHHDGELRGLRAAYLEPWIGDADPRRGNILDYIRINAEVMQAEEAFPRFDEIVFDSPDSFESKVDHFLASEADRRELAVEMREAVLTHFTYQPQMARFLASMASYLERAFGSRDSQG